MSDSESEQEYEYYDYGRDNDDKDEIIVSGGGMMNGNAYATVKQLDNGYIRYREYGKNSFSKMYRNHYLDWNGHQFDIKEVENIPHATASWATGGFKEVYGKFMGLVEETGDLYSIDTKTMKKKKRFGKDYGYGSGLMFIEGKPPPWADRGCFMITSGTWGYGGLVGTLAGVTMDGEVKPIDEFNPDDIRSRDTIYQMSDEELSKNCISGVKLKYIKT